MTLLSKLIEAHLHEKDEELIHFTPDLLHVLVRALFQIEDSPRPFISLPNDRKQAFGLLLDLVNNNLNLSMQVIEHLSAFFYTEEREYNAYQMASLRGESDFVGLRNLGNTCYINSLIQQLFHNTGFRNRILTYRLVNGSEGCQPIFREFQRLFAELQLSSLEFVTTKEFCNNFKVFDGNPINSNLQQDVNEFFNLLMDSLENAIKETAEGKANFVTQCFTGTLKNSIISIEEEFPFQKSINEPFINISLDIRNRFNLPNALDNFMKGSVLDGDNKYFCDDYSSKISVKKEYAFKQVANSLTFVLNRFEYDHINHQRKKLNDYFEFPFELDINKWLCEEKKNKDNNSSEVFNLSGVIIHSGSAEAGHYYSYIKIKDKWFEFNDTKINEKILTSVG